MREISTMRCVVSSKREEIISIVYGRRPLLAYVSLRPTSTQLVAYPASLLQSGRQSFLLTLSSFASYRRSRGIAYAPINTLVVVLFALQIISRDDVWHLDEVESRNGGFLWRKIMEERSDGYELAFVFDAESGLMVSRWGLQ